MSQAPGLDEASLAFLHKWEPAKRDDRPLTEGGKKFDLVSEYQPAGDQPQAIAELIEGIDGGARDQVLLGVTGSGKTFTMAHVIQTVQRPTIILAPNKTLAAQLYGEMKEFFDRCYYPVLGRIEGRAFATMISAGSDGEGAQAQINRIAQGWRLKRVADPVIVNMDAQTPEEILAEKTVPQDRLDECAALGEAMAEGLSMGVF